MKKFFSILLCIMWMGFIYYNSSQDGISSNKFTNKVVDKLITIVEQIQEKPSNNIKVYSSPKALTNNFTESISKKDKPALNKMIRKIAHVTEFFILAILLSNAFFVCGYKGRKAIIYILFITLFYAVLDEFHQLYTVQRGSSVEDVLIDFLGGIIGVVLYYLVYYLVLNVKKVRKT